MKDRSTAINWFLFAVFSILTVLFVKWQVDGGMMLINETIAMILFCLGFPLKIYRLKIGMYVIFALSIILLFQPINYSYTINDVNTTITYNSTRFNSVISPIIFIILMFYIVFNYAYIIELYQLLTRGSKKEQEDKEARDIDFYYRKFNDCSEIELIDIFKMYSEYPSEAQKALAKIKSERGFN